MKKTLLLLALSICGMQAAPQATVERGGLICRTKQQDAELRDWIGGILTEAHKAKDSAAAAQSENDKIKPELLLANSAVITLKTERDDAVIAKEHLTKKLHLAKWIFSGLVTASIILVCLQMGLMPPILFYVAGGAIVAANAAIWIWL